MKNRKAFTIVELLVVILILSLISLIFITNFSNTTSKVKNEELQNKDRLLVEALEVYYYLGMNTDTLEYKPIVNGSISCISIGTLISNGYLTESDTVYNKKDIAILTVLNGKFELPVPVISHDDPRISECYYPRTYPSGIYETDSESPEWTGDVDSYSFTQNVSLVDVNTYNIDLDFSFQALFSITIEINKETYVMMILDNSTSMDSPKDKATGKTPIQLANEAITKMAKTLATNNTQNYKFCTSLVNFNSDASFVEPYTTKAITSNIKTSGSTCYGCAFNIAYVNTYETPYKKVSYSGSKPVFSTVLAKNYDEIACKNSADVDSNVFVIFLTDGDPNIPNVSDKDKEGIYLPIIDKLRAKGATILTIAYGNGIGGVYMTRLLKTASEACPDNTAYNGLCFFPLLNDASEIINLLESFAWQIINDTKKSEFTSGIIEITINNDHFKFNGTCDGINRSGTTCNIVSGNQVVNMDIDMNDLDEFGVFNGVYDFSVLYDDTKPFVCPSINPTCTSYSVQLYNSINLIFKKENGDASEPIAITNIPKVLLSQTSAAALN